MPTMPERVCYKDMGILGGGQKGVHQIPKI